MTSATTQPVVIYPDGVYAPILQALLSLMTPTERAPVKEIMGTGSRSESGEKVS